MAKYTLLAWWRRLISGKPHVYIGGEADPYMLRWYLIPKNRFFNLFLHKFMRSDDDRAVHDHPFAFVSLMIRGKYVEHLSDSTVRHRFAPSICFRKATHQHWIQLFGSWQEPEPCWTIVLTGPRVRDWGFWCPKGFVKFDKYFADGGCESKDEIDTSWDNGPGNIQSVIEMAKERIMKMPIGVPVKWHLLFSPRQLADPRTIAFLKSIGIENAEVRE